MKKGATKKLILNIKNGEILKGLKKLCDSENLHLANMSNKLSGKIKNNTDYLYVKEIDVEIKNPYFAKDGTPFNIEKVFTYMDKFGGGTIAIVNANNKRQTISDRTLENYIQINDFY